MKYSFTFSLLLLFGHCVESSASKDLSIKVNPLRSSDSIASQSFQSPRACTPRNIQSPLFYERDLSEFYLPIDFSHVSVAPIDSRIRANSGLTTALEDEELVTIRKNCIEFTELCCNVLGNPSPEAFEFAANSGDQQLIYAITAIASRTPQAQKMFAEALRSASR